MRGEVNNIQRGELGRVSTPPCPLANSTAGHPWVTSLSKGQRVLKCPDSPAALGGAGGVAQRARIKLLSPFIIQRQSSPQSGPIFPWPCLQRGHNTESPAQMFYSFSRIRKLARGSISVAAVSCSAGQDLHPGAGSRLFLASKEVSDLGGWLPRQQILLATDIVFPNWGRCPGLSKN